MYMPSRKFSKMLLALAVAALAMGGAGCHKRSAPTPAPVVIVPSATDTQPGTQPSEPATTPAETKPMKTAPAPSPELVVPPVKKTPPRTTPPRTAPAVEPPSTPAETAPKPAPPRMSPRLSPTEQAEYERKTNTAIAAAENNMQKTFGKQLNAAQSDLLEKIRGFLGQAREAARAGDWQRAFNLAEKAQVLSVELVNSL
jgi:outer membrane biosynthesis protein TonB